MKLKGTIQVPVKTRTINFKIRRTHGEGGVVVIVNGMAYYMLINDDVRKLAGYLGIPEVCGLEDIKEYCDNGDC